MLDAKANRITFYRTKEDFGFCSNFSRHSFTYLGRVWPTSEHAYQAMKFKDLEIQERIRSAETPKEAANLGRDRSLPMKTGWEDDLPGDATIGRAVVKTKDVFMYAIVLEKFRQNAGIAEKLLNTSDAVLVEDTSSSKDGYWGETAPGVGENRLGEILMLVRSDLRKLRAEEKEKAKLVKVDLDALEQEVTRTPEEEAEMAKVSAFYVVERSTPLKMASVEGVMRKSGLDREHAEKALEGLVKDGKLEKLYQVK